MYDNKGLNQGTIRHLPLDQAIEVTKKAGFSGIGIWSERIPAYVDSGHSKEQAYSIINNSGLNIIELIYLKEWLFVNDKDKQQSVKNIEDICETAAAINADCITAPAYGIEGDFNQGVNNFKQFCDIAANYGVKVAIEFVPCFKTADINSAMQIVDAADKDNGGIVIDTFHVFKGPTSFSDIEKVPTDRIFLTHLCDGVNLDDKNISFIEQAREHRAYPGEGEFDLTGFVQLINNKNYQGYHSLEVLNKQFIDQDPNTVAQKGIDSLTKILAN